MRTSSVRMGYLLVVLAVVLVPVVAQNQCYVSLPQLTCPSSVCFQVSRQLDKLQKQLKQLENSRQVEQLQDALQLLNNRLNRLENTVLQEKACARATVAEGLSLSLTINNTVSFSVLARDCGGYDLTTGGDNVTGTLTSVDYPSCVSPEPTVVDNGDGSYQVSLTPECSGNSLVSVSINGKTIKDMPVTVGVIPPYTSLRLKRTITSINHPYGIDFTENGDVFISSWNDHHVHHFDRNGEKMNIWRTPGDYHGGILVHGNNIYVSQCTPPKVYNYTRNGTLVGSTFIDGCYIGLVIGPDGRLYASDPSRGHISIFNMEDGSLFHQITGTPDPRRGIGFDQDGNLHAGRGGSPVIQVFTRSGVPLHNYTPPSAGNCDGLFIDKAGNVLVADRGTDSKVIIIDKNNNLLHKLVPGPGHTPVNVAIAPNGNVWVANVEAKTLIYYV